MTQITQDELAGVARRVQKLLNLANNNPNEAEASSAMAKAQEILVAYNLDMAQVGQTQKSRADQRYKGGLYKWQRSLWEAVANLNFCMYWSTTGTKKGQQFEHRVLGSYVNVVSTQVMADYLQQAIERLAREWFDQRGDLSSVFAREVIAYREGLADRISERLQAKRREQEYEARRKQEEEKARQSHPAYAGGATKNALTVLDIKLSETDLNLDHIYGKPEGWHSEQRAIRTAARAAEAEKLRIAREEQAQWERDNPEEAAKKKAEKEAADAEAMAKWWKEEAKRARRRKGTGGGYSRGPSVRASSYYSGYDKGADVSLDRQVGGEEKKRLK